MPDMGHASVVVSCCALPGKDPTDMGARDMGACEESRGELLITLGLGREVTRVVQDWKGATHACQLSGPVPSRPA